MTGQMTREEAAERFKDSAMCASQSRQLLRREPRSFQMCTKARGHEGAHTSCDGQGHVLARWRSETSLIEVWLPDGHHLI